MQRNATCGDQSPYLSWTVHIGGCADTLCVGTYVGEQGGHVGRQFVNTIRREQSEGKREGQ